MLCFYWGEAQVQELFKDSDSIMSMMWLYAPSVLHVVYTNVLATVYRVVAQALTDFGRKSLLQVTRLHLYRCEMAFDRPSSLSSFREPQRGVCLWQTSDLQSFSGKHLPSFLPGRPSSSWFYWSDSVFSLQFTFFNYFAVLFHIAFFKQDVPLLRKVAVNTCVLQTYSREAC